MLWTREELVTMTAALAASGFLEENSHPGALVWQASKILDEIDRRMEVERHARAKPKETSK